jgi:hypothetical protein
VTSIHGQLRSPAKVASRETTEAGETNMRINIAIQHLNFESIFLTQIAKIFLQQPLQERGASLSSLEKRH